MKKMICFFLLLFSNYVGLFSQIATLKWANDLGAGVNPRSSAKDSTGNIYITGEFSGSNDFDPGPGVYTLSAHGGKDVFVAKFTDSGSFIWAKHMGGSHNDGANSITVDKIGNIHLTGYFQDTADFDPGMPVQTIIGSQYDDDVFITKLNNNGDLIWVKSVGDSLPQTGISVKTDLSGNVIITGTFKDTVDFDPGAGINQLTSGYSSGVPVQSVFVLKLDINGNFVWAKGLGIGNCICSAKSVDVDAPGNIHLTGEFRGIGDFDPGPLSYTLTPVVGPYDYDSFICKLDLNGNLVWAKNTHAAESNAISVDMQGNVYTTGKFTGSVDFNPSSSASFGMTSAYSFNDIYVSKLDINGNFLWAVQLGHSGQSGGLSIVSDKSGNVYSTGYFAGGINDFDPGPGSYGLPYGGNVDAYVCKLSATGTLVWASSLGSVGGDEGHAITIDTTGSVFYAGIYTTAPFTTSVDFDPGPGAYNLTQGGGFISKLAPCNGTATPLSNTTATNQVNCPGSSFTLSVNGTSGVNWYPSVSSTSVIGTGFNFITPGLSPGSHTYYAEISTCTLTPFRIPITVTVSPAPSINLSSASICTGKTATITASNVNTYTWSTGATTNTIVVSPTVTTAYSVSTTNQSGCAGMASITLTVNALPNPTISASSSSICSTETATLTASGGATYYWSTIQSSSSITVSPGVSTNYTLTAYDANNCANTTTFVLQVTPTPNILFSGPSYPCPGTVIQLTATGANSYTWSTGAISNTVNVIANSAIVYSVTGSTNGCISTKSGIVPTAYNPTVSVSSNTTCYGGYASAMAYGANTYSWSTGATGNNIFQQVFGNETFTVVGTNNYNCNDTAIIQITLTTPPVVTLIATGTSSCIGAPVSVVASGATTYEWSNGILDSYFDALPVGMTTFTVIGRDSYYCTDTTSITIYGDTTCYIIWPGDANSDGAVNNLDVLELGLHYTQTGGPRSMVSNTWQAFESPFWTGTISDGENLCHSDCDGNGLINANDTVAINLNYSQTHAYKLAHKTTQNGQLMLIPDQNYVTKGSWGTASIYLGDASNPVNDMNGVAFSIAFDPSLIEGNNIYLDYQTSFLNASADNLHFRKWDISSGFGALYTATTHTVANNVSGFGKIATLHYQINSTLTTDQTLYFDVYQANGYDENGIITTLASSSETLVAVGASVGLNEAAIGSLVSISPNPANSTILINSTKDLEKVEILTVAGQILMSETVDAKMHLINIESLANGVYFVKVYDRSRQVVLKKLVIQK